MYTFTLPLRFALKATLFYAPTLLCCCYRLLSWTGRGIEPVGVDYVLQKLGFSHARTTIPKWIQRGIMDPCDLMCAALMNSLLEHMINKNEQKEDNSNKRSSRLTTR